MRTLYLVAIILVSLGSFFSCQTEEASNPPPWDLISLAKETEQYIKQAKYTTDNGANWKIMPDSTDKKDWPLLYMGSPGIILFYLELFNATGDSVYLHEAINGADHLVKSIPDTAINVYMVGLYTGVAGMGYTLTEMYKVTQNEVYKNAALSTIDKIIEASEITKDGIKWAGNTDVIYGSSGVGLYFQYLSEEFGSHKADSLSYLIADELIASAIASDTITGLRWKSGPEDNYVMDNFSHGASGIAYYLVKCYQKSKKDKYLNAALETAQLLDSLENEKGYIPHHLPGGEDLYYLSYCHGPAGTSRFYFALYEATKDRKWLNKIEYTAQNVMLEGIDTIQTDGYWNNISKCCGTVGVAEYYLWLFDITGNEQYLNYAHVMTNTLINKATRTGSHIKWIQAENRRSPDQLAAQTGLMQGSAGIGLWFLKLNASHNNKDHLINLPDMPEVSISK